MNILDRLTGQKLLGLSLLLGVSVCFGYAVHNEILLRLWQVSSWGGFGILFGLTALFVVFFYRMRGVLLPPGWEQWRWYQKTGLVCASLLLSIGILQSGLIPFNDLRDATITISALQQEKEVTTYYCTGLFDHKKRRVASPGEIAEEADVLQGVKAVNKGNGLWCRMPDMSTSSQVRWTERIQGHAFPLSLGFAVHPSAGKVTVGLNGKTKTVDLYSDKESTILVALPAIKQQYSPVAFLSFSIVLAVIFYGSLVRFLSLLNTSFVVSCKHLAEKNPALFTAAFIAIPVIAFNMFHVFGPRYLLHDDPFFYRVGINHMVDWWRWTVYGSLAAFTEGFSFWMMAHYSPYLVRLFYVLLYLTGISFCVYWIARQIFNLSPVCSYLAAVLPAIYPMQYQIIAGVNMSYTLVGTLVALFSLIAGFCYLIRQRHSWILFFLSGGFYTVSTKLMEQAVFLSAALGFLYLVTSRHWKRKILLLLPVVLAAGTVLHRMITKPRGAAATPHDLPWDVIWTRSKTFLMYYLSPIQGEYGAVLCLVLLAVGFTGFFFWLPLRDRMDAVPHFSWLPGKMRLMVLPIFAVLWTIPSALPFVAMKKCMPIRTLHVAGYGPWLIAVPGLIFSLSFVLFFVHERIKKYFIIVVVSVIIVGAGVQHMLYARNAYKTGNYYWTSLSRAISYHSFSEGSQIVITNATTGTHHSYLPCSGYLSRMLGNRLDIGGLVGPELFYYDSFAQCNLWLRPMTGLKSMDNLHLFRWVPHKNPENLQQQGILKPYNYFLRVVTDESEKSGKEKTGDWYLYKLGSNGKANVMQTGHGLVQYKKLLVELKKNGITPQQICWGNSQDEYGCNSSMKQFSK